ncbi:helix-turn-helix domain-containing protein [Paenibacillus sp. N3/727]|uniref:ArsR/SmtB family transcription factor n=1 Tax=Paenibacillus sp. N3/727 TaxID=2925845 RepID=UPI001F5381BF|nr:winged helix-turn-helix domain-containing protein [Paenibacillus sp. N3/727]UNK17554.1 helix-turn-helix domain-containing protein [Paenibacillus sp. N3/727]
MNRKQSSSIPISVEQSKLLGSAQRVKIIGAIADEAKTAKQVADELGQSPGSTHYHIQKLHDGGLIDLVETRTMGGIVEKYYISKAKWFDSDGEQFPDPILADDFVSSSSTKINLRLALTPDQREELTAEFKSLMEKWVALTSASKEEGEEFAIGFKLISAEKKSGS